MTDTRRQKPFDNTTPPPKEMETRRFPAMTKKQGVSRAPEQWTQTFPPTDELLFARNKWHMLCAHYGLAPETSSVAEVLNAIAAHAPQEPAAAPPPDYALRAAIVGFCAECEGVEIPFSLHPKIRRLRDLAAAPPERRSGDRRIGERRKHEEEQTCICGTWGFWHPVTHYNGAEYRTVERRQRDRRQGKGESNG